LLASSKFPRLALAVTCLLAVSLLVVIEGISSSATTLLVSDLLQAAVVLWAAYCCFHVARHSVGYLRQLWMLLAASLSIAAGAQGLETYYHNKAHLPAVTPWPSDVLFIFWVTPAVLMLLPRPAGDSTGVPWKRVLDIAQVGVIGVSAYLYFFYVPSQWQVQGPQMVFKIMRLQLFRDLALGAVFLIRAATVSARPIRQFFRRICVLFLLASASDVVYLLMAHPLAGQAGWSGIAWSMPYLFATVFAATWKNGEVPKPEEERSSSGGVLISQILPVCAPLLVLFLAKSIAVEQITTAWGVVTCSFILSVTRLILTSERQRRIANELLKAKQSQARSEHMFSTAFRLSPDAVGISQIPEGRFLEVNDTFTRFTGYAREETLGRSPAEMNLWVDVSHRAKVMAKLLDEREVREEEFEYRTKQGEIRVGEFSASVIELDGELYALAIVHDITARKQAEEGLRASEKRLRNLFEDLHVGVVLLGPMAETRFANRAALATFGITEDQAIGKSSSNFGMVAVREDGTELPFSMRPGPRAIETKQPIRNEVVGWRRAGSSEVLWTLVDAVPHLTDEGEVASVILSISNITERKKAEEALKVSEKRFRTLLENLHVGIVLLGHNEEIQFANEACLAMFGMEAAQVLGRRVPDLGLVPLNEDGTQMALSMRPGPRAVATRQAVRNEVMGWRRSGSNEVVWILGEAVPLFNEMGELDMLIGSFSDITKRKQAEEALHQLSTRLLQLQDEERRRIARELHDSLAQSVLAVNLDLAQVARSSVPFDERTKRALSKARGGLQEMSREIRTLSYLLHPPVLDELGLASAVQEYAKGFGERSGIKLDVDLQPNFGRLRQETETALFRIVQESLSNIQRHSGSQTARIRLREELGSVQLEVSDQGRGMGQATTEPGNTAGARLGVGILGMRERMVQLGGRLDVESSSSGTKVRATIPVKVEVAHAPSHPSGG
jgi:PAS domain S-box-containing protein